MHVLAVEPYFGGSHRAFLENLSHRSRHDWSLLTLPARHWKWRMRSAPAELSRALAQTLDATPPPDLVFASDMLDVPGWTGLLARDTRSAEWIGRVPLICYFHENQWVYPTAPGARDDHHYGFTNLLSAAAADACWFNSEFNRASFLSASRDFLRRMPDSRVCVDIDAIQLSSRVIAPGFVPPRGRDENEPPNDSPQPGRPLRLGWVGRFEHDKRPDRFARLLDDLDRRGIEFQLILLGARGRRSDAIEVIEARYADRVLFNGFAEGRREYERWLAQMDVVVSTAEHEFFGIAVCEAIWAGAVPVVPDGLSYVEYVPDRLRYSSIDQAAEILQRIAATGPSRATREECRARIADYRIDVVVDTIDRELERRAGP